MNITFCDSTFDKRDNEEAHYEVSLPRAIEKKPDMEALYQQYRNTLLLQLKTLVKDHHIAEELLHDTFIRLSKMPALSAIRRPRPFLFTVANNLAFDYLRKQQQHPAPETENSLSELTDQAPEQLEVLIKEHQIKHLMQAISNLQSRAREALLLAKFREMTLREVAHEMGISQTMVEKHLKSAIHKCRTELNSETY